MAKDPAFLFYYQDFLVGTAFMSLEDIGAYIRILCHLADKGKLSENELKAICGTYVPTYVLREKFKIDDEGFFYNERLRVEVEKRKSFCKSRQESIKKRYVRSTSVVRMENENSNTSTPNLTPIKTASTTSFNKGIELNFEDIWSRYPKRVDKKAAFRHYKASVKTEKDFDDINTALTNYLKSKDPQRGFIKNGSTWFNNWRDYIDYKDPVAAIDEEQELLRKAGLLNDADQRTTLKREYSSR